MRVCRKRRNPKKLFAPKSFRWSAKYKGKDGNYRHLIGCPRGEWDPVLEECRVGTRIYETILFPTKQRCPAGYKRK